MADDQHLRSGENADVEVKDRGLFDFLGKKEEHHEGGKFQAEGTAAEFEKVEGEVKCGREEEEVLATEFEKVQVTEAVVEKKKEEEEEEKKGGLLEKLHRSHSTSSSSSSDEEEAAGGEGEKKKKKKKSLKDKIKEKISGEKKEGEEGEHKAEKVETEAATVVAEDNTIPVEKIDELPLPDQSSEAQEKKSLLDKIKEKLPGGGKKPAEEGAPAPPAAEPCPDQGKEHHDGDSPKEKKGFLGKIMDKIPGYHKTNGGAEESGTAAQ